MTEPERAEAITRRLRKIYPDRRPLLEYTTPYELLISVILSAQTTDNQVNRVTPELFGRYATPVDLAGADQESVESIVHSTGFYRSKARNIIGAAHVIHERFGDTVPEEMTDLLSIPGVGRKSANVIRGVVYGHPSIVVDTHLTRVCNRLGFVTGRNPDVIERELRALVPDRDQTDFSMGVNLHGRARCHARRPDCGSCEIRRFCPFQAGAVNGSDGN